MFLFFPAIVFAQNALAPNQIGQIAAAAEISPQNDLITIIGRIINVALGAMGIVLLGILLYAGYLWMTAGGDAAQIEKAQKWIRNGIIGLVIIASAFAITQFILGLLLGITTGETGVSKEGVGGIGFPGAAGSLGGGIIEYHAPPRDATGVPRNTSIIISFKEAMDPASFIE